MREDSLRREFYREKFKGENGFQDEKRTEVGKKSCFV
jgi:hypothetical protein